MTQYCQLTYEQRCQIKGLFQANFSIRDIAKTLFVSPSTISRELKRNRGRRGYRHKQAQCKAFLRRKLRSKSYKMSQKNIAFIKQKLTEDQWSPEQISGYLKRENMEQISYKTIYSYIWKDKANGGKLYLHLRHHRKKRKQYGKAHKRVIIKGRISIDRRPGFIYHNSFLNFLKIPLVSEKEKICLLDFVFYFQSFFHFKIYFQDFS